MNKLKVTQLKGYKNLGDLAKQARRLAERYYQTERDKVGRGEPVRDEMMREHYILELVKEIDKLREGLRNLYYECCDANRGPFADGSISIATMKRKIDELLERLK